MSQDSLDVLYVELTGGCNFSCIHCGNENGLPHLEFSHLEKLLEEFAAAGGRKLILTGGEPLLYPRLEDVLEIAEGNSHTTKLSTNSSLLGQFSFVFDYDLGFRVSLDGTREVHNSIRRNKRAYDHLITAMKKISEQQKQLIVRTTVMKQNEHSVGEMLWELDRLTNEEDISIYSINIWPVRDIGKSDTKLQLSPQKYRDFLYKLNTQTRELRPDFRIIVGPTFGMEEEFAGGPIQSNQIYKCDILNTSLHVAANGDIYPCSFVHYLLGNISEMSIRDVFRSEKAVRFRELFLNKENLDCRGCSSYESCRGGCIAEVYGQLYSGKKVKDVYCGGDLNVK